MDTALDALPLDIVFAILHVRRRRAYGGMKDEIGFVFRAIARVALEQGSSRARLSLHGRAVDCFQERSGALESPAMVAFITG
jgi:hypothetical protein